MTSFDLASFDVATFDPAGRPAPRRPVATRPPVQSEPQPTPAPVADPGEVARLGEAVASLSRQLGEAQALCAALAKRMDDQTDEPRRKAVQAAHLQHLIASRFASPV